MFIFMKFVYISKLPKVRTSHIKTPNDQTSLLEENLWSDIASGDIHIRGRNSPPR